MKKVCRRILARRLTKGSGATAVLLALSTQLAAPATAAEDPAVAALTQPTSSVEVGGGNVSDDSYKFGEYNGLEKDGGFLLGNLDLFGGGRYDSASVTRWQLHANDIGLASNDTTFSYRQQGQFRFDLGFDELRHNVSDTYQTPYLGLGGTSLTLPPGWIRPVVPQLNATSLNYRGLDPVAGQGGVVNSSGVVTAPTDPQLAALAAIVAGDTAAYRRFNLQTQRRRGQVGFQVNLNREWLLTGSASRETRDGFRPIGAVSSAIKENSVVIPDVIDTTTDQFNLGLAYTGKKAFLQVGYYGSMFSNRVAGMSWQDPNDATLTETMGSAPSNQFHQFNLTGGVNFSGKTRLVADLSYGRSRQNDSLLSDASLPLGLPRTTADATVVTKLASLKLTTRPTAKLGVSARYKYTDRDNQTPVDTFVFYDANLAPGATPSAFNTALGLAAGTLASNVNILSTRPQSKQANEFNLGGDYALGHGQKLSGGFDYEKIERSCDQTWINCADAPKSISRNWHGEWHAQLMERLGARLSYGYDQRRVHYDPNAWLAEAPMAAQIPGGPIVGATTSVYGYLQQTGLTGFGPLLGYPTTPLTGDAAIFSPNNNIVPQSLYGSRDNLADLPGLRRYNLADRNRDRLRFSMDWDATDRLSLLGNFEYDRDDYLHSVYGLQNASAWTAGIDGSYALSNRLTISGFYTHENQRARQAGDGFGSNSNSAFIGRAENTLVAGSCYMTVLERTNNGKLDPCLIWSADTRDQADTAGLAIARRGLLAHRLDLSADVVYSRAHTDIGVDGASYANNPYALAGAPPLASGVPAILLIPAADLPSVVTDTYELRLSGRYALSHASDLRVVYQYAHMKVRDFAYLGSQFGTGTEQLPTLEQAPDYDVNVIAVYYRHRF